MIQISESSPIGVSETLVPNLVEIFNILSQDRPVILDDNFMYISIEITEHEAIQIEKYKLSYNN